MQLDAIYDQGRLEFLSPVRFAHDRFVVRVDIPESELQAPVAPVAEPVSQPLGHDLQKLVDRLAAVRRRPLPDTADLPPLSAKAEERLDAWAGREDR